MRYEAGVAVELGRRPFPDGSSAFQAGLLVPGRRPLPLDLGRKAGSLAAGEGVGLEPGDVLDRRVEIGRPAVLPAQGVCVVVTLLPGPALLVPPGPVLVAAAFGERQEGHVRHRSSLYRECLMRYTVPGALVVVGEAAGRRAHLELARGYLEPVRLGQQ